MGAGREGRGGGRSSGFAREPSVIAAAEVRRGKEDVSIHSSEPTRYNGSNFRRKLYGTTGQTSEENSGENSGQIPWNCCHAGMIYTHTLSGMNEMVCHVKTVLEVFSKGVVLLRKKNV